MFDPENNHRRKSSIVSSEERGHIGRSKSSACFIHSLLETQKQQKHNKQEKHQALRNGDNGSGLGLTPTTESSGVDTPTHSRLLTKKQLSDMAYNVRELSKRLGNVRLKLNVRKVFLLTKAHDETLIQYTREVAKWLLSNERETQFTVYEALTTRQHSDGRRQC